MTRLRTTLLAGVAAIGIGLAGAASAQNAHVMTVPVPGGGVAQIHYVGDVPPQIVFVPAPAAFDAWTPAASVFGPDSPFAMMDRIAAEMDRRAAAMFRYAEAMADRDNAGGPAETGFGAMPFAATPGGGESYSYVSTVSGNDVCMQSVQITSRGDGTPPVVERHSSGNCGTAAVTPGRSGVQPAAPVPVRPSKQPDLILTQGTGTNPYAGMVRHVAAVR
jgi:hypothetical protein